MHFLVKSPVIFAILLILPHLYMVWYKKVLKKNKKEIVSSATFLIIFVFALQLWNFALGKSFVWHKIEPFAAPDFFNRTFYSALVYATIGALLYAMMFYKFLHFLIVRQLRSWVLYKGIKKIIWILLMLGTYSYFSKIVDFLNSIISFLYNIFGLILYALPPLGISMIISVPLFIFANKISSRNS